MLDSLKHLIICASSLTLAILASTPAKFVVGTVKDAFALGTYSASHTVAFIYRTNAQSRASKKACVQENLPYVVFGPATTCYKPPSNQGLPLFLAVAAQRARLGWHEARSGKPQARIRRVGAA